MDLRYYLTFGLLLTALADFMFGLGHTMGVHEVMMMMMMMILMMMVMIMCR